MSTRKIAISTLWQIASQVTMAALGALTVKIAAVSLSLQLAGFYNTAYGYLQIFGILADFGLYAVSVREASRAKDPDSVLGTLLTLRIFILLISLGSALIIAWVIPQWHGTALPLAITIAAFVPAFTLMAGTLRAVFQVHYKMQYVFIAEVAQRAVTLGLMVLLLWAGMRTSEDPTHLLLLLACGGAGSAVLLLLSIIFSSRFARVRLRWDPVLLKKLLLTCAPYGLAFLCTSLYRQFDITLIGLLRPDYQTQNALYGFVPMDMAYVLPTFLLNSTLPILSARDGANEDTREFLGKIFLAVALLGITSMLFSAIWARPLMRLLTAERYLSTAGMPGADSALQILGISMFGNCLLTYCFYVLLTKHRWKPLVATLAIGVVASFTSNLILIPRIGFLGAAATSAGVHLLLTLLLLPQAQRVMPAKVLLKYVAQAASFTLLVAVFLLLTVPLLGSQLLTLVMLAVATLWMGACVWMTGLHRTLNVS